MNNLIGRMCNEYANEWQIEILHEGVENPTDNVQNGNYHYLEEHLEMFGFSPSKIFDLQIYPACFRIHWSNQRICCGKESRMTGTLSHFRGRKMHCWRLAYSRYTEILLSLSERNLFDYFMDRQWRFSYEIFKEKEYFH